MIRLTRSHFQFTECFPRNATCDSCSSRIVGSRLVCFKSRYYSECDNFCSECFDYSDYYWRRESDFEAIVHCTRAVHDRELLLLRSAAFQALDRVNESRRVGREMPSETYWVCVYCMGMSMIWLWMGASLVLILGIKQSRNERYRFTRMEMSNFVKAETKALHMMTLIRLCEFWVPHLDIRLCDFWMHHLDIRNPRCGLVSKVYSPTVIDTRGNLHGTHPSMRSKYLFPYKL
jgi:hypothetical protein